MFCDISIRANQNLVFWSRKTSSEHHISTFSQPIIFFFGIGLLSKQITCQWQSHLNTDLNQVMSDLFSCKVGPFQMISFSLQIMLLLKAGSSWNKYFINRRQIFLSGLFGGLFVSFFIKSWIFKKITGQSVTVSICQSSDCKLNSIYTALQVSMLVFVSIHPSKLL